MLRSEIIREKGTNRSQYFRGEVDKYSWVDIGSSYLPSEMNVAYLYAQLEIAEQINERRLELWNLYYEELKELADDGKIEIAVIPDECKHNAHMFWIKTKDLDERTTLLQYLADNDIKATFHYVPLHSSMAGKKYGTFVGEDKYTTRESDRLIRLPMFYSLKNEQLEYVVSVVKKFYNK